MSVAVFHNFTPLTTVINSVPGRPQPQILLMLGRRHRVDWGGHPLLPEVVPEIDAYGERSKFDAYVGHQKLKVSASGGFGPLTPDP